MRCNRSNVHRNGFIADVNQYIITMKCALLHSSLLWHGHEKKQNLQIILKFQLEAFRTVKNCGAQWTIVNIIHSRSCLLYWHWLIQYLFTYFISKTEFRPKACLTSSPAEIGSKIHLIRTTVIKQFSTEKFINK